MGRGGFCYNSRMKTQVVLVFQRGFCPIRRQILDGLSDYARKAGWRLQVVAKDAPEARPGYESQATPEEIRDLVSYWKPDACIVDCSGRDLPDQTAFGRVPTVFLDTTAEPPAKADAISTDAEAIVHVAARELLSIGFGDYAYLPWMDEKTWSVRRGEAFARVVRANGRTIHLFDGTLDGGDVVGCSRTIADWLARLPKPCGVFAVNDHMASLAVSACTRLGLSVPSDVAVIGVDNNENICENAAVTLSSIGIDLIGLGVAAARLLDERLSSPRKRPSQISYEGCRLVRRASTRVLKKRDAHVAQLLEYIRRHACEGVRAAAVAQQMGCSRRYADRRFREITGMSILDEIQNVRIERVKDLLRKRTLSLSALPDFCGYRSLEDLRRVFRSRVGLSLTAYRRAVCGS